LKEDCDFRFELFNCSVLFVRPNAKILSNGLTNLVNDYSALYLRLKARSKFVSWKKKTSWKESFTLSRNSLGT
jgi:hypothetical protein